MPSVRSADFSTVTEVPGLAVTRENLAMAVSRYSYAASLTEGADVLEVGCGQGQGLGWLVRRSRRVVGGDYTPALLAGARRHYGARVPLVRLDGQALPFRSGSFDVVLLLEAIYYLPDTERCARECRRVLRPGGVVLVCTTNPARADFNPSPLSTGYVTADALAATLEAAGFDVELSAAFPCARASARTAAVTFVKRLAVGLGLIPRTMRNKALLKRIFLGPLVPYPLELDATLAPAAPLSPIGADEASGFKVIYALGRCPAAPIS